jgi:pimeloyl-ACP methyl ester carboxylesterase
MKPHLVLLPGMMCDERLFAPQISLFSSSHLISTPSFGTHRSVTLIAEKILKELPPSFSLLGLSMGGIIAMEMMRLAAHRVSRLALLDTNPFPDTPNTQNIRNLHIKQVQKGNLKHIMKENLKPKYLAKNSKKYILNTCMNMALSLGNQAFISQSMALRDRNSQENTLHAIHVPTLILCGKEDTLCPLEQHTFMNQTIPQSVFAVVEKAGHLPTLEQPSLTNRHLQSWLQTS